MQMEIEGRGDHLGKLWRLGGRLTEELGGKRIHKVSQRRSSRQNENQQETIAYAKVETVSRRKTMMDSVFSDGQNQVKTKQVLWIYY